MIEVRGLHKSFDGNEVLKGIDVDLYNGKVNQIIGLSGSGKTVLMKSIIGLFRIDKGTIKYHGRNLPDMRKKEVKLLRREVGMLFQGAALFDSLTVLDNVLYPLEMFARDMTRIEREKRAKFCLSRVNIDATKYGLLPAEISGGMQKRVAIARAITLNPKYLFCDEPNSGLDPVTSIVIDRLIQDITCEYDITTVINTHDMNSIMEIGDHIVLISKGHKVWQGDRTEVFSSDNEYLNEFVFASELFTRVKDAVNNSK
ncbi:MAG: ATP-binding cassette domain-containing protein [bacterium]